MPDPEVVRFLQQRKQALLLKEQAVMRDMARQWLKVEKALEDEMVALAADLASSNLVSEQMILQHERYTRLLYQARAQVAKFNDTAEATITKVQADLSKQGIQDALRSLRIIYNEAGIAAPAFDVLPVRSLEIMFGYAADGSPLRNLLSRAYPDAVNGLTDALVKGLAFGNNPIDVAEKMAQEFGIGLNKALTVARTETLRSYRMANMEQYRESGVVNGYKRLASKDGRTCPGCLFRDGELIESLDGEFDEHPNGRCTAVPVVIGIPAAKWESGLQWFAKQPEDTQKEILGAGRFDAWKNGADLKDMSKLVNDPTWGGSYVPTPVGELGQ